MNNTGQMWKSNWDHEKNNRTLDNALFGEELKADFFFCIFDLLQKIYSVILFCFDKEFLGCKVFNVYLNVSYRS